MLFCYHCDTTSVQRSSGEWALCATFVCVSASVCLVHWVPGDTVNVCVSERTKQWACFKPAGQWGSIRPG